MTVFPPPVITPLLDESDATGTPSCVDAMPSSSLCAYAAAARVCVDRDEMPPLPPPPPVAFSQVSGWA